MISQLSEPEIRGRIEYLVGTKLSEQVARGLNPASAQAEIARQRSLPLPELIAHAKANGIDPGNFEQTSSGNPAQPPAQGASGAQQFFNTAPFTGNLSGTANSAGAGQAFEQLSGGDANILGGLQGGKALADIFFPQGALGRLQDVASETQLADDARLEGEVSSFARSPEAIEALKLLATSAQTAGNRSPEIEALIRLRESELGGLTGAENQALREQGLAGVNSSLQTALRAGRVNAASSGVQGGAASIGTNPAIQQFLRSRQGLERDLILANIDEQEKRKTAFQGLLQSQEQAEFTRGQTAREGFSGQLRSQEEFESLDKADRLDRLLTFRQQLRDDLLNKRLVNLDLSERERAGQLGAILGGAQFGAATSGRESAEKIALNSSNAAESAAFANSQAILDAANIQAETALEINQQNLDAVAELPPLPGAGSTSTSSAPTPTVGTVQSVTQASPSWRDPKTSKLFGSTNRF